MVVLPEDSGPKISTTRPRGKPPTPSAASKEMAPVGITAMGTISFEPSRMMEPLPNCFSICANAKSIAFPRSSAIAIKVRLLFSYENVIRYRWADYTLGLKRRKGEFAPILLESPKREPQERPCFGRPAAAIVIGL